MIKNKFKLLNFSKAEQEIKLRRQKVKKHPFIVKRTETWSWNKKKRYKYYVINEQTGETWRTFSSRRDAYEYAYYSNGNIEPYRPELWY